MLKSSRESQEIRIEDAAHALHIRTRYLQALEDGKLEELPGRAYAKGYLLAYAGYLDIDKDELLRQFEKVEASLRHGFFLPEVLKREKKASPRVALAALGFAITALVLWSSLTSSRFADKADIEAAEQQWIKNGHISTLMAQNVPCFKLKVILYPPCYAVELDKDLLPLKRRITSVMELRI